MTTASDLITEAVEIAGIIGGGETLSGNDAATCLRTLNNMLDSWNTESMSLFTVQEFTHTTANPSFTIGVGGNINTQRPTRLEDDCFFRVGGVDYLLAKMTGEEYSSIAEKSLATGLPTRIYYDAQSPLGTCYLWPQPTGAIEIHVRISQPLSEFATLATDHSLPQGYRKAISYNLAIELNSGKFPRPIQAVTARIAAAAKKNIKRLNRQKLIQHLPEVMTTARGSDIFEG